MKKYILLLFLFFIIFALEARTFHRKISWKLTSESSFSAPVSDFDGAYINENNLPVYIESIGLGQGERIRIINPVFSSILHISDYIHTGNIPVTFEPQPKYIQSNTGRIAWLEFIPLLNEDGKIKKLISFDIEIVENRQQKSLAFQAEASWVNSSVLANGKWVKIRTSERGIHQITYSQLGDWGFSDPSQVKLYGNGGYMLPKMNDDFYYDDLQQNSVWYGVGKNGENSLFFYSTGTVRWELDETTNLFKHERNDYSDYAYYYLSDAGSQKTIETLPEEMGSVTHNISVFQDYTLYEAEKENLIKSGRRWFGEEFISGQQRSFSFSMDNLSSLHELNILIESASRSSKSSAFDVLLDGDNIGKVNFGGVNTSDPVSDYAAIGSLKTSVINSPDNFNISLKYNASISNSSGWLDYIEINGIRDLIMDNNQLIFRDLLSHGDGNVARYHLSVLDNNVQIWDITDYLNPKAVVNTVQAGVATFKASSGNFREYVAFYSDGDFPEPEKVSDVNNQNLHQSALSEMIIITNPNFRSQANELAAFHNEEDGMTVQVITPSDIYNEFSSGMPDIAGIRNFLRMCYDRGNESGSTQLKYVLLLGDGSFDNKNILGHGNNLLPTYQSANSLSPTSSFVTDDFFALLDAGEGEYSGLIDLGIGRIPAKTTQEAQAVIQKIKNYVDPISLGDWRNVVCFIGDDEDNSTHMAQAENLATSVNESNPSFFTDKIYFDAYMEESTPGGERYPDVTDAINNRVKKGALILNYTGHANETSLASERVLGINDIDSWSNYNKLPIFVTATCEISRFDAEESTAGEHILFNPNGGGIGLFSTTRLVYSNPNFILNKEFYEHVFSQDENGDNLRMGEVMRRSKNGINTGINKRNFTLLADPALQLSYPKFKVVTETVNGKQVGEQTDTISSLSTVVITGKVTDHLGNTRTDFNGELIPVVYDKVDSVQTLGNGGEKPMSFRMQNNIIYKGVATVTNGTFEFTFIVPKDISYSIANGKIIYYADNGEDDAQGYSEDFYIGGSSGVIVDDVEGPTIDAYLNDQNFQSGDEVGKNPILFANVEDEHGINTVGTGIGHDITAVLDGNYSNIIVLNDFYLAEKDSYQKGQIIYPIRNLSVGEHTLTLKIWDVLNNSSEVEIRFTVSSKLDIEDVFCYPNPLTEYTNFVFKHNRPDESFDTRVEIFDMSGSLIDIVSQRLGSASTTSLPLFWQLSSSNMLFRSGAYLYRITIDADDGASASKTGRMIISKY